MIFLSFSLYLFSRFLSRLLNKTQDNSGQYKNIANDSQTIVQWFKVQYFIYCKYIINNNQNTKTLLE